MPPLHAAQADGYLVLCKEMPNAITRHTNNIELVTYTALPIHLFTYPFQVHRCTVVLAMADENQEEVRGGRRSCHWCLVKFPC